MTNNNGPVPILVLSDSVDYPSGLSRIARDVGYLLSKMPEFRVASVGRGGRASSKIPFHQYVIGDADGWGEGRLQDIWNDFAGNDRGVLFTIWDASRVRYLVDGQSKNRQLVNWLASGPFEKWGYFPVDAEGIGGRLTGVLSDTISRFDRVLAYGLWGKQVIENSIGREVDWLPHGVNMDLFKIREKTPGRMSLGVNKTDRLIGMVATNQARKDYGLAFATFRQLLNSYPDIKFWIHTDEMVRHWNLYSLAQDFGLNQEQVVITMTGGMNDEELSWLYNACDLTVLPSSEGFGYPIVESLACGVPVIHGSYAGGSELIQEKNWLVKESEMRVEGIYNQLRPVWRVQDWVNAITHALNLDPVGGVDREECRRGVEHLNWPNLAGPWKKWLLKGVGK